MSKQGPPRPEGELTVGHVQAAVRERLDEKGWDTDRGEREVINTVVWETMVLLGEWELVQLLVPAETLRKGAEGVPES